MSAPIFLGSGRYLQASGAIEYVGRETGYFGHKAIVVAGDTSWGIVGDKIIASLKRYDIEYFRYPFSGYCGEDNTLKITKGIKDFGADVVIAVGGGRCMDASKWAAHINQLRIVTVPTSAATCAACVALCIHYHNDGSLDKAQYADEDVAAVIVDDDILALSCPPHLNRSGMIDALGKWPELTFSGAYSPSWTDNVTTRLGVKIADFTFRNYLQIGRQAMADLEKGSLTKEASDLFSLNLLHTGMISSLVTGGRQLAVAHAIYYCVTRQYPEQRQKYLHGEIVSSGLALQMAINGCSQAEIAELVLLLKDIGAPSCISDIDVPATTKNKAILFDFIKDNVEVPDLVMKEVGKQVQLLTK